MASLTAGAACADAAYGDRPPPDPIGGTGMMTNQGPGSAGPSVGMGAPVSGSSTSGGGWGPNGSSSVMEDVLEGVDVTGPGAAPADAGADAAPESIPGVAE